MIKAQFVNHRRTMIEGCRAQRDAQQVPGDECPGQVRVTQLEFADLDAETERTDTDRFDFEGPTSLFSDPASGAIDDQTRQDEHDEDQSKEKNDSACQNKTFPSEHKSVSLKR